jgi:hypothetical protein
MHLKQRLLYCSPCLVARSAAVSLSRWFGFLSWPHSIPALLWTLNPVTPSHAQATDAGLLEQYRALLSPEEAAELAAAPTRQLWRERLLARTLTRTVLGRYCHPVCG